MSAGPGQLRVIQGSGEVCEHCAPIVQELHGQIERLQLEVKELERDLRIKRTQNSKLRGDRNRRREISPFAPQAEEVWERWREVIRPGAREFGHERFDAVVERLEGGYTVEDLFRAIEGARVVLDGEVGFNPRNPTSFADLKNICREPASVDRFMGYVEEAKRKRAARQRNLREAFLGWSALCGTPGRWSEEHGVSGFCPMCTFTATLTPDGRLICENGCAEDEQRAKLRDWFQEVRRGKAA